MEKNKLKYDAFISYRHNDLDKFVATNLHRLLETYKLPKSIIKANNLEKTKINRVFRDQEELPLANSLEDPIVDALTNSEFLIVICSPRLKESMWCKKEIETFIKLHGREHVLAVLVEGEPADSFPKELLEKEEVKNGKKVKTLIEPLALDCRGNTKKEVLANLKKELLRLIAPMFNLNYDDLKRRHHERKVKNIIRISVLSSIMMFLFLLYMSANLIIIKNKQKTILNLWALNLAKESDEELAIDNRYDAILKSYQALTKYEGMKMPKTSEAIDSLTSALDPYEISTTSKADSNINTTGIAKYIKVSSDGKYLLIYDTSGTITLYNLKNRKVEAKFNDLSTDIYSENNFNFVLDKYVAYNNKDNKMVVKDYNGKLIKKFDNGGYVLGSKKYIAINAVDKVKVYDQNFNNVYDYKVKKDYNIDPSIALSNGYLVFNESASMLNDKGNKEQSTFTIVDLKTKKDLTFTLNVNLGTRYIIDDDTLYLLSNLSYSIASTDYMIIFKINLKDGKILWEKKYHNNFANRFKLSDNKNVIYVAAGSSGYLINTSNGEELNKYAIGKTTVKILSYVDSDNFMIITNEGNYFALGKKYKDAIMNMDLFKFNISSYDQFEYSNYGIIAVPYNDTRVVIYKERTNDKKEIDKYDYKPVNVYESDAEKKIEKYHSAKEELVNGFAEVKEKKIIVFSFKDNTMEVYNTKTKELLSTIKKGLKISRFVGIDKNDNIYLTDETNGVVLNSDYEKIASIKNLVGLDKKNNQVIIKNGSKYYKVNILSEKELLKKAKDYLK